MKSAICVFCRLFLCLFVFSSFPLLPAFAACSSPSGNAGDIIYSSIQNTMAYCNGSVWVAMGSPQITFGTLTTNDFCTAASSSSIQCTTGYTGSGNVVLDTSATLTSPTLATPTMTGPTVSSGGLTITAGGITVSAGGPSITGTVTGTTFSGSGASLTNIGTMTAVTGAPSSTTYLRGDNTWAAISASLPSLTNDYIWVGNGSNVATAVQMSQDVTITNAGVATVNKIQNVSVGSPTGTAGTAVVLATSPSLTTPSIAGATLSGSISGGTFTGGTWNGSTIGIGYGGTNATSQTGNGVAYYDGTKITTGSNFNYNGTSIGLGTATAQSLMQVYGGEVQVGTSGAACAANNAGAIRYNSTTLYYCNGSSWTTISSGGGSGTVSSGSQYQMAWYPNSGTTTTVAGDSNIYSDSSNDLLVPSGKLGVGTATPLAGLHVHTNAAASTPEVRIDGTWYTSWFAPGFLRSPAPWLGMPHGKTPRRKSERRASNAGARHPWILRNCDPGAYAPYSGTNVGRREWVTGTGRGE